MELSNKIASDITVFTKYAKHLDSESRRESWSEILDRVESMFKKKYPSAEELVVKTMKAVRKQECLGSMRSLQFGGIPIERNNSRVYNCAYESIEETTFFNDLMFLLLGGTGVGYSVQNRHISELPAIKTPKRERKFLVGDSIEGWADSVKVLFKAYFEGRYLPRFDYSDIREKGANLVTAGGKAPGPEPLMVCLTKIKALLMSKKEGDRLSSVECSDIACYVADAVLSGGIRRAAMICLFDKDDEAMLGYKSGDWYKTHPHRERVNCSAIFLRGEEGNEEAYNKMWEFVTNSGSGEPAIYWTNDYDMGTNPCCEIALKSKQFCNLTTINFSTVKDQKDLDKRAYNASVLGTLQAGFTDFHYLGEEWEANCKAEALLGVSVTGIADGNRYKGFDWGKAAKEALRGNEETAEAIGINKAARVTCIKPEGTTSLALGTASGIHARHAHYYIRRMGFNKNESISQYLMKKHPELVEDDIRNPNAIKVTLPQKSPERSIYRHESVFDLLERAKYFYENWVLNGHREGANTHNVSCTASVKPDEWKEVGQWLWDNRDSYNGISVYPYFDVDSTQKQLPFEDTDKKTYDEMIAHLKRVDLSKVVEDTDETEHGDIVACAGNKCEI